MRKVMNGILFLTIIGSIVIGCQKENVQPVSTASQIESENDIASLIKIVDVETRIREIKSKKPIIIVQWDEWGRMAIDCRGWGLCDAQWFPEEDEPILKQTKNSNGASTILEFDDVKNQYYIDILLDEEIPSQFLAKDINLKIDEPIALISTHDITNKSLLIPTGNYPIINSLGSFGGYRIYLN